MPRHIVRNGALIILIFLLALHLRFRQRLVFTKEAQILIPIKSKLVFPTYFPIDVAQIPDFIHNTPPLQDNDYYHFEHVEKHRPESVPVKKENYHEHPFQIYDSSQDISMDLHQCGALQSNFSTQVSEATDLHTPLCDIVARLIAGIDMGNDPYLRELAPYFDAQLRLQLKHDVCHRHWFRLAGSSVYLEDHGFHLLISRLAYSPDGNRRDPKFSLAYAQVYNEMWQEVNDVSLVIPTNEAGAEFFIDKQGYKVSHYPQILPVPFFHKYREKASRYLGPEDPRLILRKNENGHEEPMMVFNLHHQKFVFADDDEDNHLLKKPATFRSMWVSFPWQFQRGKTNVDDLLHTQFDNSTYNKAIELRIKNLPRQEKQKNWTPMISDADREEYGYDKTMLFMYRWTTMQVLRCDLETGKCGFVYQQNDKLKVSSSVGPFRGGTQMINIRHMLQGQRQNTDQLLQLLPPNREIWLGFARAHLVRCGCGNDLYRPNLVVVTKDRIMVDGNPKILFKISHVSSFVSLNVEILPWEPLKPYKLCSGTNALIPNGISHWTVSSKNSKEVNSKDFMDELVLAISVQDITVWKLNIKGLLRAFVTDQSLFLPSPSEDKEPKIENEKLLIPSESEFKANRMPGYSNDALVCAMLASVRFCADYAEEKLAIEKDHILDTIFLVDTEAEDTKMENYLDELDALGLNII